MRPFLAGYRGAYVPRSPVLLYPLPGARVLIRPIEDPFGYEWQACCFCRRRFRVAPPADTLGPGTRAYLLRTLRDASALEDATPARGPLATQGAYGASRCPLALVARPGAPVVSPQDVQAAAATPPTSDGTDGALTLQDFERGVHQITWTLVLVGLVAGAAAALGSGIVNRYLFRE